MGLQLNMNVIVSYNVVFQYSSEMLHCIDNASIQTDIQEVHLTMVKTVFSSKYFNINGTSFFGLKVKMKSVRSLSEQMAILSAKEDVQGFVVFMESQHCKTRINILDLVQWVVHLHNEAMASHFAEECNGQSMLAGLESFTAW